MRACPHCPAYIYISKPCDILCCLCPQTFRELFPGLKSDEIDSYGPAATLSLPGMHVQLVNRCLGNRDRVFTDAVERFLGDNFDDAWWWTEHLQPKSQSTAGHASKSADTNTSLDGNAILQLLSSLPSVSAPSVVSSQPSASHFRFTRNDNIHVAISCCY